jgi:hypothetical protein
VQALFCIGECKYESNCSGGSGKWLLSMFQKTKINTIVKLDRISSYHKPDYTPFPKALF